jgi:3-phenylpropionate/trans-cinnamate dioxygenase ferredoxin reductase subunit
VERIVIVGAGECGARAALALRDHGFAGDVTVIGDESRPPYERPPLSKSTITNEELPPPATVLDSASAAEMRISLRLGSRVSSIERSGHEVVLDTGERLPYTRLLLSTGAQPRPLPVPADTGVYALRTYDDALALRGLFRPATRVGIIGGGFIGLELAASASARGCAVTVVEAADRVLARGVPEAIALAVSQRHAAAGVAIHCGVVVERVSRTGSGWTVFAAGREPIRCDLVVAGVGAIPDTALAAAAGLRIENGVAVDEYLVTSDPDILAAGDCCSLPHLLYDGRRVRLESWRNAQDQGTAAARNLLGGSVPYRRVPWFWSDQHDLSLQVAGLPDPSDTPVVRSRDDGVDLHFGLGPDGRLRSAAAIGPGNAVARDIRLAELLIDQEMCPVPAALADPVIGLKSLLAQTLVQH